MTDRLDAVLCRTPYVVDVELAERCAQRVREVLGDLNTVNDREPKRGTPQWYVWAATQPATGHRADRPEPARFFAVTCPKCEKEILAAELSLVKIMCSKCHRFFDARKLGKEV